MLHKSFLPTCPHGYLLWLLPPPIPARKVAAHSPCLSVKGSLWSYSEFIRGVCVCVCVCVVLLRICSCVCMCVCGLTQNLLVCVCVCGLTQNLLVGCVCVREIQNYGTCVRVCVSERYRTMAPSWLHKVSRVDLFFSWHVELRVKLGDQVLTLPWQNILFSIVGNKTWYFRFLFFICSYLP